MTAKNVILLRRIGATQHTKPWICSCNIHFNCSWRTTCRQRDTRCAGDAVRCGVSLGIGGLGMSIEGPGKVDIKCFENPGGTCRVAYNPSEPGTYQLSVKYADEHIPGHAPCIVSLLFFSYFLKPVYLECSYIKYCIKSVLWFSL